MLHGNRTIELGLLSACAWIFSCVLMPVAVDAHDESPRAAGHSMHSEAYDEGPRQAAYLMDGMPELEFPVSTASEEAERFFNQGIGQLHGFWYFEAERSFRQVALLDTNCIMALWGMAMANHSNEKRAKEFLECAIVRTNDVNTTARERLYIHSLAKFHGATLPPKPDQDAKDKPKDAGKAEAAKDQNAAKKAESTKPKTRTDEEENQRHRDYIKDLEQIVEDNPDDLEAKAFLVFKIWDAQGRMRIRSHMATEALAQEVLRARPLHPVHHGRIHFWNYEADRRAVDAAAKCGQGSPGIAHMWHMPGHTYDALHRYADAAWQQEASARVDHAYMIRNRVLPDQIHNFAHNNEWLVRTLNKLGRIEEAIDLAKNMIELPRHPRWNNLSRLSLTNSEGKISDSAYKGADRKMSSASFGRARLIETLVNWELWDQTLQIGNTMYLDPTELPEEQVQRIRVLALACFAKGDIEAGS
ncbi:MAG: hypothetical protein FJ405_14690, partial [Verrucomicrobia bacterium]|nr:hypothetical protein [Verrucomicrobiota bacterium]